MHRAWCRSLRLQLTLWVRPYADPASCRSPAITLMLLQFDLPAKHDARRHRPGLMCGWCSKGGF
jgi:hypothetical protein